MEPTEDTSMSAQTQAAYAKPKPSKFKVFLTVLVVLAACGSLTAGILLTNKEATNQASASPLAAAQVTISAGSFSPDTVQVKKGQAVIWSNEDQQPHMLAIQDSTGTESTGSAEQINQGESYSFVFDQSGTFSYYDATNPLRFKGVIIVE